MELTISKVCVCVTKVTLQACTESLETNGRKDERSDDCRKLVGTVQA